MVSSGRQEKDMIGKGMTKAFKVLAIFLFLTLGNESSSVHFSINLYIVSVTSINNQNLKK